MDIYVFDKSFNLLGIIDQYSSLIWTRELYGVGSFELHAFVEGSIDLLKKGNLLVKEDSPKEAVEIETVILDDEDSEKITVQGFFIKNFLNERIVWKTQTQSGKVDDVIKGFVKDNCVTPTDLNRIIPNLTISESSILGDSIEESNTNGVLSELIVELALKYDVGWDIIFDSNNQKYVLDVYVGKDLSIEQFVNPQVVFSLEYENVLNQRYTDSDSSHKNVALIGGQGEGTAKIFATVNSELSGFERKEMYLDAVDIAKEGPNGAVLPNAEYIKLLEERGKSRVAELQPIKTFESGISVMSNLLYKRDFDLGDKVTIEKVEWGIVINTRITTVEEVYENNSKEIRVNFGSIVPTLIDKIKRAVK